MSANKYYEAVDINGVEKLAKIVRSVDASGNDVNQSPLALHATTPGLYASTGATANTDPGGIAIPTGAVAVLLWFETSATDSFRVGGRVAFRSSATAITGITNTSTNLAYVSDTPQSFMIPDGATHIHVASGTANAVARGQWYVRG